MEFSNFIKRLEDNELTELLNMSDYELTAFVKQQINEEIQKRSNINNKNYEIVLNNYKYLYGNNFSLSYEIYKSFTNYFNKTALSEYQKENNYKNKILLNEQTIKREFDAFNPIKDHSPKYVLSLDKVDLSHNGIAHLNIEDFLLHKVDITLT